MPAKKALTIGAAVLATGVAVGGGWLVTRGDLVTEVIDGDSFRIANKQVIRLTGLNAPELQYCYGPEAKVALTKKILNKHVVLRSTQVDYYRRVMALVYLNGELINAYMVKYGFGESNRSSGDENQAVDAAKDYAQKHQLGIYSKECTQLSPPDSKCKIKGNINNRTNQKEFLTPDCWYYDRTIIEKFRGEDWFCTEKQASKVGFTKASACP